MVKPKSETRPTVEECIRISTSDLKSNGQLKPGSVASRAYTWNRGRKQLAQLTVTVDLGLHGTEPAVKIGGTAHGKEIYQIVLLEAQPMRFGGVRWFFICPKNNKLCTILLLIPGTQKFISRMASGLPNKTQRLSQLDRANARIAKKKARLANASFNTHKSTRKRLLTDLSREYDRHFQLLSAEVDALVRATRGE